jgi:hypothetical protein
MARIKTTDKKSVQLEDFIIHTTPGGISYRKYRMTCLDCNQDAGYLRMVGKNTPCRECGIKKSASDDFIWETIRAGSRGEQRVRKVRKNCKHCNKDMGYANSRGKGICYTCSAARRTPSPPGHNGMTFRKKIDNFCTRSTYETFFAEYLIENNIKFTYEPRWYQLSNGTRYLPDFYIEATNQYIEIKGRMSAKDQAKIDRFRSDYPHLPLIVLDLPKLKKLGYRVSDYKLSKMVSIKGLRWRVIVLDDHRYNKRFGEDSEGITESANFSIYIKKSEFNKGVLLHELGHAYFHSCLTGSANLEADSTEEIFCEILAHHGSEITELAESCYEYLRERLYKAHGPIPGVS